MKALIGGTLFLLATSAFADQYAASGKSCSITHRDCYPACVQFTPDGSDCAKTRNVCKDICGPKPSYPSITNTERADVYRFEVPAESQPPQEPYTTTTPPSP